MPQPRRLSDWMRSKSLFDLRRVQRAGWFVHDDDAGVLAESLGDFDQLLDGDGKLFHRLAHVNVQSELAEPNERLSRAARRPAPSPPRVGIRPRKILSATLIGPISDNS